MNEPSLGAKLGAEFLGTFGLVFGGCGSAVLAAAFPAVGIGLLGVSLAFGLTVLTMAFAIGHISGCHLTRPVPDLIREAGFTITELDVFYEPGAPRALGATSLGTALGAPAAGPVKSPTRNGLPD